MDVGVKKDVLMKEGIRRGSHREARKEHKRKQPLEDGEK